MWVSSASLTGATWRKSSHSGGEGQCVELAHSEDWAAIRDSKNPDGPAMVIKPARLRALVHAIAAREHA